MSVETLRRRASWFADYASALTLIVVGIALIAQGVAWML